MATSSKVLFDLETLRRKALESLDLRIAQAQTEVDSYFDDDAMEERLVEWRQRQERKISVIFSQLGDGQVDDYRLAQFSLDPIPTVDKYARRDAENRLAHLKGKRSQVEAKAEALVADDEGRIALTKTQLAEFFGL